MSNRIEEKSIGFLIDELITTSMRCWFAQEDIMNPNLTEEERLAGAIRAQEQNAKRSSLIRIIDGRLGDGDRTQTEKTYTYFKDKK
jgi:hypothetical protein